MTEGATLILLAGLCACGQPQEVSMAEVELPPIDAESAKLAAGADPCIWLEGPEFQPSHRSYSETRNERCEWTDEETRIAMCQFESRVVGSDDIVGLDMPPGSWRPTKTSVKNVEEGLWCIP